MRMSPNRASVVGGILGVAALLAGCGGGSQKPTTSTTSSSGSSAKPSTSFSTANVSGVGSVLVDGRGKTVYILTSDGKTNVPCTDSSGCTGQWPDLPLPDGSSGAKAGTGVKASLLGTKKESDGETYPTYNGWLMYEYAGDSGPAQSNGQGITSFGGTWYVLDASGDPVKSGGSSGKGGY
jgi:predicted lipoprotein with Yx(FWY)xxD motif